MKNIKVQHIVQQKCNNFKHVVDMLHFVKLIEFFLLFYLSSDESNMVDSLYGKSNEMSCIF